MTRRPASFARHADAITRQAVAETEANRQAAEDAARARVRLARETEAARVRLTAADLDGATHVRDRWGWHEVVRVNDASVTVRVGPDWDERLPIGRVLEVRR